MQHRVFVGDDVEVAGPEIADDLFRLSEQLRLEFKMADAAVPAAGVAVGGEEDHGVAWQPSAAELFGKAFDFRRVIEVP